jgi:hypothetical protein
MDIDGDGGTSSDNNIDSNSVDGAVAAEAAVVGSGDSLDSFAVLLPDSGDGKDVESTGEELLEEGISIGDFVEDGGDTLSWASKPDTVVLPNPAATARVPSPASTVSSKLTRNHVPRLRFRV